MAINEVYIKYQDVQSDVSKEHRVLQSETHNRVTVKQSSIKLLTHVTGREYCFQFQ
jgi:hypothetical protein